MPELVPVPFLPLSPFFFFSGDGARDVQLLRLAVKMARVWCSSDEKVPGLPTARGRLPLKRVVLKTDENGNLGRHFVSCLSIPMMGRDGKVRSQFLPRNVVIFCSDLSKLPSFLLEFEI